MLQERLSQILRHAISKRVTPGAQYAIVCSGGPLASGAVGRFTYDADSPEVTTETVYDVASLTKVVTGTAMAMLLYEEGRLDLERPICEILPEICAFDLGRVLSKWRNSRKFVNFRMLLAHSSGLPDYAPLYRKCKNRQELLDAALRMPLEAPPLKQATYSDIGFILLGLAMERIAGEPIDAYVRRRVLEPLKLHKTSYLPTPETRKAIPPTDDGSGFRKRLVQGEVHDDNCFIMNGISAHAGLFSTAEDLAKFAQCLLRGGSPVFNSLTIQRFTRKEEVPNGTTRALGWDTPSLSSSSGKYFSFQSFGHLGYTGTSLWIDPVADLGVVLLTNRVWPNSKSQEIKKLRPAFHDVVREELGLT